MFKPVQDDVRPAARGVIMMTSLGPRTAARGSTSNRSDAAGDPAGRMETPHEPVRPAVTPKAASRSGLFDPLSDGELLSLGVPEDLLPRVRSVGSESELDVLQPSLPVEAYEGLFLVAAGDTVDQVLRLRETRVDRPIDTLDFAASLETPESQARFVVVDGENELTAIMNAPLAQWRVFLHPTQRTLATGDRSGPVRVLGGAGTGKTVAMHRAKWLAENRTPEGKKVLFTTFTRNLAFDIEENPALLLDADYEGDRVRIFAWVPGFTARPN